MLPVPLAPSPIDVLVLVQLYVIVPPVVGELKLIEVAWLLQTTRSVMGETVGVGFTEMVKSSGVPEQITPPFSKLGVTVMVAVTGEFVVFVAWNEVICPLPLAPSPIEVFVLVQSYVMVPPEFGDEKVVVTVLLPLQTTWSAVVTLGVGLTVIVNVRGVPEHALPFVNVGVTVMVATRGWVPVFVAVKLGRLPVPLAGSPIFGSLFVQL